MRFVYLLFTLILFSCELTKEIDYETLGYTPKIIINGFISNENGVNVMVKSTVSPSELNASDYLASATVYLYEGDNLLAELVETDSSKYELAENIQLKSNVAYHLKVEAEGYETAISADQYLLTKVAIDTVYVANDTINWAKYIYVDFYDKLKEYNYYALDLQYYSNGVKESSPNYFIPMNAFNDEGYTSALIRSYYKINGSQFDSVKIYLYTIPKVFYDFVESFFDYEMNYGDYDSEFIFTVTTNITNGYGVFSSYEVDTCLYINKTDDEE